jgi:hypothetical protein
VGKKVSKVKSSFIKIRPRNFQNYQLLEKGLKVTLDINNKHQINQITEQDTELELGPALNEIFDLGLAKANSLEDFIL